MCIINCSYISELENLNHICISDKLTLLIETPDNVVDIVREETPPVQDGRQHGSDGSTCHVLVIQMLVHL